jgi:uncharacterized protein (TIGR02266 family)
VRGARELLTVALRTLQALEQQPPDVRRALDHVAAASSALYTAQNEATSESGSLADLRVALDELTRALDILHSRPAFMEGLDTVAAAVAQALALLYPRVRMSERQRKGVVLPGQLPSMDRRALVELAGRIDQERRELPPMTQRMAEQRVAGPRVTIEVDVGVLSESNFYAGVAADVSAGGVFVSTRDPLPVGTEVALYFTFGAGHTLHAEGMVRWSRAGDAHQSSGMGVAFSRLSDEDRRAIADYCANRPPLVHD